MYNLYGFSLIGMKHYFDLTNEPLFENIELFPGGIVYNNEWEEGQEIPPIDKDCIINYIMENNGSLFPLRQIPDQFKYNVETFFKANYNQFRMMWIALNMDYNPIDNYDKKEYILDEYDSLNRRTDSTRYKETNDTDIVGIEKNTETPTGTEQVERSFDNDIVTTNELSADNGGWDDDSRTSVNNPKETNKTSFTNRKTENELQYLDRANNTTFEHQYISGNDLNEHQGSDTHKSWIHGNAGTTMTADIIAKDLQMREFDFYEYIAKLFSKRLLVEVY